VDFTEGEIMTEQRSGYYRRENNAGISDVVGSFMRMATAGTRFTIDQMFNAMSVFTDPTGAMNRVKTSMDNISGAMRGAEESSGPSDVLHPTVETEEELTGRKA